MAVNKFSVAPASLPTLRYNFTTSGTLVVPAGVNYMYILTAGGGGGAGNGSTAPYGNFIPGSAGGGSGGVANGWVRTVPGDTLTYTIAAAGGSSTISSSGDFPFSFTGGPGNGGGSNTPGTGGTTSSVAQALQFINAGLGVLPTTTIGIVTAPHYSGAGGAGVGLAGGGATGDGAGGIGLAGTPTFPGGSGISEKSNSVNGGVGGGGGGGAKNSAETVVGTGGIGAIRIYY